MRRSLSITLSLHAAANPTPITALPMHFAQNDGGVERPLQYNAILSNQILPGKKKKKKKKRPSGISPKLGEIPREHRESIDSLFILYYRVLCFVSENFEGNKGGRRKKQGVQILQLPICLAFSLPFCALARSKSPTGAVTGISNVYLPCFM
jgi:hypothetical protein